MTDIEVSEEQSIIPEGALHKNKHHLDIDGITKKGVPVLTIDGDADTLEEIKAAILEIYNHNQNCIIGYTNESVAKYKSLPNK